MIKLRGIALAGLFVMGCAGNGLKDKVVGTWHADANSASGAMVGYAKSSAQWPAMAAQLEKGTFTFAADGTLTASAFGQAGEAGKWTLNDHTIVVTSTKPADQSNTPAFTLNNDGSRIHMRSPGGEFEVDLVRTK